MTTLFDGAFAHRPVVDAEERADGQWPSTDRRHRDVISVTERQTSVDGRFMELGRDPSRVPPLEERRNQ
jgi:hypothetical protein